MSDVATTLTGVLGVLALALGVRLLVARHDRVAFASALVAVGLFVSAVGLSFPIELTSEIIFLVLLPAILFEGTTTLDVRELRHNTGLIAVLTLVGLPLSVALLGLASTVVIGLELPVALLFAAVILPTDPAAVLSLFEEFDVAERLAVTVEGESLFNDGVAIVIFSSLLAAYRAPEGSVTDLATPEGFTAAVLDVAVVGGGGLLIGLAVGYVAHRLVRRTEDTMGLLLTTILVAYGSFLITEHYLHLSGVLATVGAGLAMGAHQETHERISDTERTVQTVWETLGFLVTTALYVLIGASVQLPQFAKHAVPVATAAVLVVVVRAVTIYPLVTVTNLTISDPVPRRCQHIMVWGGLHTVVPVALVLALPGNLSQTELLETMVFGVAIISLVIQGLLMPALLDRTGLSSEKTPS
jgi:CPA1 family monovalent cation:H+ antiporter